MVFVYGTLEHDKPFLAHLFAFVSTHVHLQTARKLVFVRSVLQWLRDAAMQRASVQIWGAHAGGRRGRRTFGSRWWLGARSIPIQTVSVPHDQALAPAFQRGLLYKSMSALELLVTTLFLVVFGPKTLGIGDAEATVTLTGSTDCEVSSNVVARGICTSLPLSAVC